MQNTQKRITISQYPQVRAFADEILENLRDRFGYPSNIAFENILFALLTGIVDFKEILN